MKKMNACSKVALDNIYIVLQRPRFPENIGAAARAMRNMGLSRLIVVEPENFDLTKISKMATHACYDTVSSIARFSSLKTALTPFGHVVGTTARLGKGRRKVAMPSTMAENVVNLSQNNKVAIVFGPEDRGLTNEDLKLCHSLVNIPTADFSSLNLAQAVMIICYELFTATGDPDKEKFIPRLAKREELDGMYDQLEEMLLKIEFSNPQNPDYWTNRFRSLFSRFHIKAKEVRTIRGLLKQIDWYGEKRFQDGIAEPGNPDRI